MSKISELTDGGSLLPTDFLIAVRSGGNVKVQADDITVDQIRLGDNEKIELGNSQDLQIYHDGSNSYIKDAGTGDLRIWADSPNIATASGNKIFYGNNGNAELYTSGGALRLATSATGIDVTGTVTATSLEAGSATFEAAAVNINILETNTTDVNTRFRLNGGDFIVQTLNDAQDTVKSRLAIDNATGDINLGYEDTGTTPKLVWDASAESLGIGTADPSTYGGLALQQSSNTSSKGLAIVDSTAAQSVKLWVDGTNSYLSSGNTGADPLVLNLGGGSVGIASNDPVETLSIGATPSVAGFSLGYADTQIFLRYNNYFSGTAQVSDATKGTASISLGRSSDGVITFNTAAAGSGVPSEVMRIGSSGKILIGDPASHTDDLLQIETPASGGGHGIQIRRNDTNTDQGVGRIQFGNNTATDLASISAKTDGASDNGALLFNTSISGGANTERLRIDSSGHAIIPAGVTLGTAAGVYAAANTLDDYEEGTWTPVLNASGTAPTVTYSFQKGRYTKVGNLVTILVDCRWSANSGGTGNTTITGLPFANGDAYAGAIVFEHSSAWSLASGRTTLAAEVNQNTGIVTFLQNGSGLSGVGYDITTLGTTGYAIFSITYRTA